MPIDEYELKLQRIKSEIQTNEIKSSMDKQGKLGHRKVQADAVTDSSKNIQKVSGEVLKIRLM